jgi:hypothetical protein
MRVFQHDRVGAESPPGRSVYLCVRWFPRAPSRTGQVRFHTSGSPSKAVLTDTSSLHGPITRRAIKGRNLLLRRDRIPVGPWTAALRHVRGFPTLRLLRRLCTKHWRSLPLPVSPRGHPLLGIPGSTMPLSPTALGPFPQLEGWRMPVPVTVALPG